MLDGRRPAAGVTTEAVEIVRNESEPVATRELRPDIGEHFCHAGLTQPTPAFLDVVPLVASPWRDQTYRGS
ncbi:hypothetical protein MKK50_12730 [Methylobacterium sp. J-043]|nr:hypothetical protein [Methylobacterium sp. J-043]